MEENRCEEILLVEDKGDLLGLSIKTLKENGHANIYITQESENVLGCAPRGNSYGKKGSILDMNFMLIYTKSKRNKNPGTELLKINSNFEVVPLLLLIGRPKDMDILADCLSGAYCCSKQAVNLSRFIDKIRVMPIYWGVIQTDTPDIVTFENKDKPVDFVRA